MGRKRVVIVVGVSFVTYLKPRPNIIYFFRSVLVVEQV